MYGWLNITIDICIYDISNFQINNVVCLYICISISIDIDRYLFQYNVSGLVQIIICDSFAK